LGILWALGIGHSSFTPDFSSSADGPRVDKEFKRPRRDAWPVGTEARVFGTILHRMILWELVKVFGLSLLGITGILLMAGIVAEASQQGLTPFQVLEIIPLLIPSTLPYTIPATTLFATCVVYGRLAADNEILAIKAAGINILKVVSPGVLLGTVMSCCTMAMYYRTIPYTHCLMRTMFLNDVEETLYTMLGRDHAFNQPRLNYAMWVRQVQGHKLLTALFKRRDANDANRYDIVAWAREAELRVDMRRKLIILHMRNGMAYVGDGTSAYFDDRMFEMDLPQAITAERPRRATDLSWQELRRHRQEILDTENEVIEEMSLAAARESASGAPKDLPQHIRNLKEKLKYTHQEIYAVDAEVQMRPALSFGCLCFILVGCPVGIWFSRSDYLSAFITCFMPIVFLYYPLMLCGTNMAKEGKFHPALTIWAADAFMVLIGLVLFKRLLRN
jgi:lipopolysaccharide export system permease protein